MVATEPYMLVLYFILYTLYLMPPSLTCSLQDTPLLTAGCWCVRAVYFIFYTLYFILNRVLLDARAQELYTLYFILYTLRLTGYCWMLVRKSSHDGIVERWPMEVLAHYCAKCPEALEGWPMGMKGKVYSTT